MKASVARAIKKQHLLSSTLDSLYEELCRRIRKRAERGETCLDHPYGGLRPISEGFLTDVEREALKARLVADGYKVQEHPDPDPGHPASGPYTTVSW